MVVLVVVVILEMQLVVDVFEFELVGVELDEVAELQVTATFVVEVEFAEEATLLTAVSESVWPLLLLLLLLFVLSLLLLMSPPLPFELLGV